MAYKRLGSTSSQDGDGMPSSPLPTENPVTLTMHRALCARSAKSFADTLIVVASSGESYMLAELCMCTDYSSFLLQPPLGNGHRVVLSGVSYMSDSGALKCLRCKLKRPWRFTSLSTP